MLKIKTDTSNASKSKEFRLKNNSKLTQEVHFTISSSKKTHSLKENEKRTSIFYYKSMHSQKFQAFIFKNGFRNTFGNLEFRFENNLKKYENAAPQTSVLKYG